MKRNVAVVVALALCLALVGVLSGCQQLGIGAPTGKPAKKAAQVTAPAIGTEGVLKVGVNADNAPFSTKVDDRMVGIDVDIAAAIADELGLSVQYVDVGTEGEAALTNGDVDILMGRDSNDSASACWLSDPYIETAVALFATSSGAIMPTADSNPSIEVQESSMSAWEVSNQFGQQAAVGVDSLRTAFEDLASGKTTFVAADVIIGSYLNRTLGTNAQIIGLLQKPGGYSVGVDASKSDLKLAVSDAVDRIYTAGVAGLIESKWIGTTLNLDNYQLSESAAKAVDNVRRRDSSDTSMVGSNAVNLTDDGAAQPAEDGTATADLGYVEPAATDTGTADPGYVDPGYVDNSATYTEPVQDATTYTEPASTAPVDNTAVAPVDNTAAAPVDNTAAPAADATGVATETAPAADASAGGTADASAAA